MKKIILLSVFLSVVFAQAKLPVPIPIDYSNRPVSVMYTFDTNTNTYLPVKREADGSLAVTLQDQTTPPVVVNFNKIINSVRTLDTAAIGDRYLRVTDTTGYSGGVGDYILAFNPGTNRFFQGKVLSIVGDTLKLDRPLDSALPDSSFLDFTTDEMAVDASGGEQTFGLRGISVSPIAQTFDVTRIIFTCVSDNAVDLTKFGDIVGGLTNGIQLRIRDGVYYNIVNFKTNQEIAGAMYDWTVYASTNPVQGVDGFVARLTFAGQEKLGVAVRLAPGTDLEWVISDNLASTGMSLRITAEGHFTTETTTE